MSDTVEVVAERVRQMQQRTDIAERRVERLEENLGRLAPVPVMLERLQQDIGEVKAGVAAAQQRQEERDKAVQELQETRGNNLRANALTLVALFTTVVLTLITTTITIALKLAGGH